MSVSAGKGLILDCALKQHWSIAWMDADEGNGFRTCKLTPVNVEKADQGY